MYVMRELTDLTYPAIAREFGGRDHTTVIHAVEKIEKLMKERQQVYDQVTEPSSSSSRTAGGGAWGPGWGRPAQWTRTGRPPPAGATDRAGDSPSSLWITGPTRQDRCVCLPNPQHLLLHRSLPDDDDHADPRGRGGAG